SRYLLHDPRDFQAFSDGESYGLDARAAADVTHIVVESVGEDVVGDHHAAASHAEHVEKAHVVFFFAVNQGEVDLAEAGENVCGVVADVGDELVEAEAAERFARLRVARRFDLNGS